MGSYTFECRRDGTSGDLFVPTVLDASGARHIIPSRDGAALCGADTLLSTQAAPASHRPDALCPRCRQRHAKKMLAAQGVSTGWGA